MISTHFEHYKPYGAVVLVLFLSLTACESEAERQAREALEEQARVEAEAERLRLEEERRIIEEARRRQQAIWNEYSENSLARGAKPWATCFGRSNSCNGNGCSEIVVNGPSGSDVVVLLKQNGITKRHAYIPAGRSYTFNIPNGTWQPFFYYGEGWYPDKEMKSPSCASLRGGFLENEDWDKDSPNYLEDNILTYTLTTVVNGNFSTQNSSQSEAL